MSGKANSNPGDTGHDGTSSEVKTGLQSGAFARLVSRVVREITIGLRGDPSPNVSDTGPKGRLRRVSASAVQMVIRWCRLVWRRCVDPVTQVMVAEQLHRISSDIMEGRRRRKDSGEGHSGPLGVNIIGWFHAQSGLGESARSSVRAVTAAGIPTRIIHHEAPSKAQLGEPTPNSIEPEGNQAFPVNLIHVNIDHFASYLGARPPEQSLGRYDIGYWVWEMASLPKEWEPILDTVNEIWTPSAFCQGIFAQCASVPVVKIPHNVDPSPAPDCTRATLGLPEDRFIFLAALDMLSTPERKNPEGALEAFVRAFGSKPDTTSLALKIRNSHVRPDAMKRIMSYCDKNRSIHLIDEPMLSDRFHGLVNACDCYVSLHRAEGFGLPLAEAMFLGKPVIATGWSGNMEFMNVGNSLLVRHELVELERDAPPYREGNRWAEPDVDHATYLMKHIVDSKEAAARIGSQARTDVRKYFSPQAIGKLALERLEFIARGRGE